LVFVANFTLAYKIKQSGETMFNSGINIVILVIAVFALCIAIGSYFFTQTSTRDDIHSNSDAIVLLQSQTETNLANVKTNHSDIDMLQTKVETNTENISTLIGSNLITTTLTESGTFVIPDNFIGVSIIIEAVGGGGGGGRGGGNINGGSSGGGSGGGSGAKNKTIFPVNKGDILEIVIGAAGIGGTSTNGTDGDDTKVSFNGTQAILSLGGGFGLRNPIPSTQGPGANGGVGFNGGSGGGGGIYGAGGEGGVGVYKNGDSGEAGNNVDTAGKGGGANGGIMDGLGGGGEGGGDGGGVGGGNATGGIGGNATNIGCGGGGGAGGNLDNGSVGGNGMSGSVTFSYLTGNSGV
jgi:hypothetical protein